MRHLSSSQVDPFTAVAGAAGALYGPLHGGANEAVLRMLEEIGSVENIPQFIEDVKVTIKFSFELFSVAAKKRPIVQDDLFLLREAERREEESGFDMDLS